MTIPLSRKQQTIQLSAIRYMSIACARAGGINMAQGICDLDVPVSVEEGAHQAIRDGFNIYTAADGTQDLKQSIADKYADHYNISVDPEEQVLVSAGATGAFYAAMLAILDPGDEVILFEPYYGYHKSTLESLGCRVRYVQISPDNHRIDFAGLKKAITPQTKALVINNPLNPSGKVFSRDELDEIGGLLKGTGAAVVSDEIYEHFVYRGREHIPVTSVASLRERAIIVSGFSKIFSITGWRIGFALLPADVKQAAIKFNDLVYVCPPAPLQAGVANGLKELGIDYYERVSSEHEEKRDIFCAVLAQIGLTPVVPEGAYYVMADISRLPGNDDREKVMHLLEKTGVAAVPGNAFYNTDGGTGLARFCFAKKMNVLQEACARLKKGLKI